MQKILKYKVLEDRKWDFSIKDLEHPNPDNCFSLECLFHEIGSHCGRRLDEIEGMEFKIKVADKERDYKIGRVNVGSWQTSFFIVDSIGSNVSDKDILRYFTGGQDCTDMEFEVIVNSPFEDKLPGDLGFDSLDWCGKTLEVRGDEDGTRRGKIVDEEGKEVQ